VHGNPEVLTDLVLKAAEQARRETDSEPEPEMIQPAHWPIQCTVGPGLEGAIACESRVGYVNGSKGCLVYRGSDIFDLCAHSTFEEVSYLLLHGELPTAEDLEAYKETLVEHRYLNRTLRLLMSFPLEEMNAMSALRMGTNLMRQEFTLDQKEWQPKVMDVIGSDEDSIAMERAPRGGERAIYEFKSRKRRKRRRVTNNLEDASGLAASGAFSA